MAIIGISGKIGSGKDTIASIIQYLTRPQTNPNNITINFKKWQEISSHHNFSNLAEWKIKKFAGKLKEIVALLIGCTLEELEDINFKNKELSQEWSLWVLKSEWSKVEYKTVTNEEEAKELCDEKNNSQHQFTYFEKKMTPRLLLQLIGTDCFRDKIHPNIHINALFTDYYQTSLVAKNDKLLPKWLITDVRFPNESNIILDKKGILIRVNRHKTFNEDGLYNLVMNKLDNPNPNMDMSHEFARRLDLDYDELTELWIDKEDIYRGKEHLSETALDNYNKFTYIIENNCSIEDLIIKVKDILIKEKIIL